MTAPVPNTGIWTPPTTTILLPPRPIARLTLWQRIRVVAGLPFALLTVVLMIPPLVAARITKRIWGRA